MFLLNGTRWRVRTLIGWDSLTDSELTVVRLITEGATNPFIPEQLHLSPHAVETHVANAFAKLGITSRAQLTQPMRRSD
jgi:DNA-binding NarL/FixJ family response regulator